MPVRPIPPPAINRPIPGVQGNNNWNQNQWNGSPYSNRYGYGGYGYPYYGTGLSIWFNPCIAWNVPWSGRYGYYGASSFFAPSYSYVPPVNAAVPEQVAGYEWGLRITEVFDGPAKKADLRAGDVILGVGKTRTQSFEELQLALAAAGGETDLVFINNENKKVEKIPIKPEQGKIGVAVMPTELR